MSANAVSLPEEDSSVLTIKPKASIFDKAVCLSITREWPPLSKALSKDKIQTTGDKKHFHASKDLYNSIHLKRLANLEIALDNTIKRYASAPFPLKNGVYILGSDLYNKMEAIIALHINSREELINLFCNEYDAEVAKAKEFQGDAFDPSDYLTGEKVRAYFKFYWNYLTMDAAENLRQVSKDAVERENAKLEAIWQDVRVESRRILRVQMAGLVNHLVDRLSPGEEGKKKIFRNTVLDPIREFLEDFNTRDLTEDVDLKGFVEKAKQLVEGVDPQTLRDSEGLRDTIQQGFADIKAKLDPMIEVAPDRDIEIEKDEVVVQ